MNKKISIPVIAIIIVIILVIAGVILVNILGGSKSRLTKVYNKMMEEQSYSFTRYDFEEKNKLITYRKEGKTLIDMYNSGEHSSTLISEGNTYLIFHPNKEYYVYKNNSVDEEILAEDLANTIKLEYNTGKEKIYGKTYKYEEYARVSDFMIISDINIDVESVKTRFYFKGNELVYIKTIFDVVDSKTGERTKLQELQTVKIQYEVDDSVFEIPSDYAEN